jgi:hypothetical protein
VKIVNNVNPPLAEVLAHHGVKGMHWGERKKKPTKSEIFDARDRQTARIMNLQRGHFDVNVAEANHRPADLKKATAKLKKASDNFDTSEDRLTAIRMTRGEKATALILAGPVGLVLIGANKVVEKQVAKSIDRRRMEVGKSS